ncbi:four helix bundle protein [Anabaena cylindrica FACHB-243]|nr:four helix bundle protein [Anabaena cylindrica FACHB-243]
MIQSCGMGILPVLVLLAGKMPAPQEILGYFFNWRTLTDQIRRSSRSVCANLAEAWRKRRYEAAFVAKLNDCEAESAETQTWIEFAVKCNYLDVESGRELYRIYNQILGSLVNIITNPSPWLMKR